MRGLTLDSIYRLCRIERKAEIQPYPYLYTIHLYRIYRISDLGEARAVSPMLVGEGQNIHKFSHP